MAGAALNDLRSAFVAETTPGTTPATPGFSTSHVPIDIAAKASISEHTSLTVGGARDGAGLKAVEVSGSMSGSLVYGVFDDWLASLLQGAWASDVLVDGKQTKTFTVENRIPAGAGGTATLLRFRGVEAVGGKLTMANEADAELSLDLLGMGVDDATTTAITGSTYTDPANALPLTSGIDVGAITMAGYTPGGIQSAEIDFAFDGREAQKIVNSLDTAGTTRGAFRPTITAKALIDTGFAAIYNASRAAQTAFSVTFNIGSVSGSKYTLQFPKCTFGDGSIDLSGATLLQDIQILPQYDATTGGVLKITRAVA